MYLFYHYWHKNELKSYVINEMQISQLVQIYIQSMKPCCDIDVGDTFNGVGIFVAIELLEL